MSSIHERLIIRTPLHIVAYFVLWWTTFASAQTNSANLQQYKRAEWGAEQGLSAGRIQALAQTRDGYLWVGTADGLFRFDGVRFVHIFTAQRLPLPQILGLTVDREGILWVRATDTRLRQVQLETISPPISLGSNFLAIVTMTAGQTSGIYATDTRKSVVRLIKDRVEQLPIHLHSLLISIAEANDRRLWIGTDRGLLSWNGGSPSPVSSSEVHPKINCLLPDYGGRVWVGTDDGLAYWDGRALMRRSLGNEEMRHLQILALIKDRENNLWIGTSKGLLRYNSAGAQWVETGPRADRIPVTALLQDREGDIWFGTGSRLERLEITPVVPVRLNDATVDGSFGPLYVDQHGRVWFADGRNGLAWMDQGIVHAIRNDGLSADEVYSIDGYGDDVWVGRRDGGLTRLRLRDGKLQSKTWTTRDGLSQNSVYAVRVSPNGTVWAGTLTKGLNRFADDHFTRIDDKRGLPANDISSIELGSKGQVWIGTSGGMCRIEGDLCLPLHSDPQPTARDVLSLFDDPARGLWIGTSHGLLLADDHGQHPVSLGVGPQPRILGLGLDSAGRLWIEGDRAVLSAMPAELLASKHGSIRTYGPDDGLASNEGVHRSRSVVTDRGGQVWISTAHELAMIDTSPTPLPTVIPHVEEVSADGTILDRSHPEVSPGAKRLSFSFTGLDLHAPSRVRFRYRLDDFDKTWSDVVSDRQATYTNLTPGKYTFRLAASNESNSWNSDESRVPVVIEPEIWQRWSVRSALAVMFFLLAVFAYYARIKFLLGKASMLADERLRERTRISRDIHDTLLQSFISSSMHLHVAERQVATDSSLKQKFAFVLEGMDKVIEDARLAVVGLRTPDSHGGIESNIRDFFLEIADIGEAHLTMRSTGRPRRLKSEAGEQVLSIAKEAVLNAVRHSSARDVQVAIVWGWLRLKVSVSDDGSGMDAFTLEHGRALHWGLIGMRERAKQLKGQLRISSRPNLGTTVSLSTPASIAYRSPRESNDSTYKS